MWLVFCLALGAHAYDFRGVIEGLRRDRLVVLKGLLEDGASVNEDLLKKTLATKIICGIDSPVANEQCARLGAVVAQRKMPLLLDFAATGANAKLILPAFTRVLLQVEPNLDPAARERLRDAMVTAGVLAASPMMERASVARLREQLDRADGWYQTLVTSPDLRAYQTLTDEILSWLDLAPTQDIFRLTAASAGAQQVGIAPWLKATRQRPTDVFGPTQKWPLPTNVLSVLRIDGGACRLERTDRFPKLRCEGRTPFGKDEIENVAVAFMTDRLRGHARGGFVARFGRDGQCTVEVCLVTLLFLLVAFAWLEEFSNDTADLIPRAQLSRTLGWRR